MASRYSNNGRTHPVGRSKSPISSRPSSKKKKTTSVKKFTSAKAISRDDDETMLSMLSAYTNSINRFEGSPRSKSPGREDPNDRLILLKSQLTDALEENAFVKSRLNAELKERHLMEAKYKELNKKFTESKKALQATGAALLQVHNQTSEMKNKRDEREIQLDEALSLNRNLNSKIAELESRLEQALLSNNTGTTTANLKKLIEDKENLIKSMEEQQVQLQSQMSKIRRDNYRLGEENAELQEALESKNRKIANLVKKVGVLEEELEAVGEVRRQISSRGRVMSPGGQISSGREHRVDAKQLESRLNNFEGDKKFLEERMAQLELSLKQSESVIQQIQGASQENSPVKAPQGSQPSLAFSYVSSGAGAYAATAPSSSAAPPPMTEKPSAPSPRKSPGVGSRPSIKASAGTNLLTPIPVESPLESSPPVHAKETPLQKHNALPSLGQATTSNGMLTDALFSSSSVIEVNKVPNAVLDKPASIPSAPMDIASPASSVSSKRSKRKKSSKERSEKSSSSSSASATAIATAAIAAATVATVAAAPVTAAAAASFPTADASLSSPKHMATVTPSVQPPVEPAAPAPAAAPTPAPVPAAPKPDPAPETVTTTAAPEPVAAPAPVPVIVPTPTNEPTAVPTPVAASEPRTTTPAPVANQVPVVSDAPISGTSAPTSKNGSRSNSIRAPISREGRGTPSTANRRPASSKKTTEGTADPAGASALTVEFGPSGTAC